MSLTNKILDLFIGNATAGKDNFQTRDQWLQQVLTSLPEGLRILDAGAGEQQYKKYCTHLQYVSQDFAQYNPQQVDAGLQMEKWDYGKLDIVSDIASIPEPDASFDVIMCTEVFEHIINPREAIREFTRLLKPGGTLIITAPFCSMTHFAPYHFYTGFNLYFYQTELPANGFTVESITPNGNYFEYLAQEMNHLPFFAGKYAGAQFNRKERFAHRIVQKLLERLSRNDKGSTELLCFGLHVVARKN
jgi:ubiquinone/menaquinone biosynthesis C-methylase UbiE